MFAITLDATSGSSVNPGTSLTVSHVTATQSNRLMVLGIQLQGSGNDISSVTYNGVACTQIGSAVATGGNIVYLYYLLAPSQGTFDAVVSVSGSQYISMNIATYYDVEQSGQPTQQNTGTTDSATSLNISNTTTVDNSLHIGMFAPSNQAASAGSNTSVVKRIEAAAFEGLYRATALVSPAGSSTIGVTTPSADAIQGVTAVFKPVAAAAGHTKNLLLLGVA